MKISDVKVVVWKWTGIPPVNYSLTIKGVANSVDMALLTIYTCLLYTSDAADE